MQLSFRVPEGPAARLNSLTKRLPLSRSALARAALDRGLREIEENPAVLLDPETETKPRKAAG